MNNKQTSLIRGTSIVSSLTLLSRILGFVREILVARLFGASLLSDAYFVALRIPNLLRSVFAEGALTSAFVPVFTDEAAKGSSTAQAALSAMATLLFICTSIIACIGMIFSREIVLFFAPGFILTPARFELCVTLTQVMFPYLVLVSFVSLLNGALNSVQIYGAAAWAQVLMNIVLIVGAYIAGWYEYETAAILLSISVIIGGIVQVLSQLPALKRAGLAFTFSVHFLTQPTIQILRLMIPALLGAAVYQVTIFITTQFASQLEPGSVSWLNYADRLTQLPIGVFTIALASVLLPSLSLSLSRGDQSAFQKSLTDALRYTSFIMIPVSVLIFGLAEPLIKLMFERGEFDSYSTYKTAQAVKMYSIGLWAVSCHSMLVRACVARKDTKTPTIIGVIILISTVIFSLLLMGQMGHAGLSLASAITFYIATILLGIIVHNKNPGLDWSGFIKASIYTTLISFLSLMGSFTITTNFLLRIILFSFIFLSLSYLLKLREAEEALKLVGKYKSRFKL